ncbi:MAG: hypothetical protein WBP81_01620 [Solirubrobacteraceae bacterium]
MLVAEVDGELRAALSVADLEVIADPFQMTSRLAGMLRDRAVKLAAASAAREKRRSATAMWRPVLDASQEERR